MNATPPDSPPTLGPKSDRGPGKFRLWAAFAFLIVLWLLLRTFTYINHAADLLLIPAIGIQAWLLNYDRIY